MTYYIAYDSGCSVCSQLAETIRQTARGKIEPLSLRDKKARELLDRAYPEGWTPGPYLIHSRPGHIRAWTGTTAAVRPHRPPTLVRPLEIAQEPPQIPPSHRTPPSPTSSPRARARATSAAPSASGPAPSFARSAPSALRTVPAAIPRPFPSAALDAAGSAASAASSCTSRGVSTGVGTETVATISSATTSAVATADGRGVLAHLDRARSTRATG
jgi:hypothetical protein